MPRVQHPLEVHGIQQIIDEGLNVHEMTIKDILILMFTELKKIEIHLSILSETEVTNQDVGD